MNGVGGNDSRYVVCEWVRKRSGSGSYDEVRCADSVGCGRRHGGPVSRLCDVSCRGIGGWGGGMWGCCGMSGAPRVICVQDCV